MLNRRDFLSKSFLSLSAGVLLPYEDILGKKPTKDSYSDSTDSPSKDLIKDAFHTIEKRYDSSEYITGVATGFFEFDILTAGLQPSDFIIFAGRPSIGKTSFCLNIAHYAAVESGVPVAIYSLDMSKEQLVQRMLSSYARVDSVKLHRGFLIDEDWERITRTTAELAESPIYINDTGAMTVPEMLADARRIKMGKGLGLIIVDYLQLMRGRGDADTMEQEMLDICRSLKAMAKELDVPVIVISQLSDRAEQKKRTYMPQLPNRRELGVIERYADVIAFIYREEFYKPCKCSYKLPCTCGRRGVADIIVARQRNGPNGEIKLAFLNRFATFADLDLSHTI